MRFILGKEGVKETSAEKQEGREATMFLNLLEIAYAIENREVVETWLSQANLGGVIISTEQYDDEILSVLASAQALFPALIQLQQNSAITSCEEKLRAIYRVITSTEPKHALCSFPFRDGEEWYLGSGETIYLSVQSHELSDEQISWLAASADIVDWKYTFALTPVPLLETCV
jgi:hypothetical protein